MIDLPTAIVDGPEGVRAEHARDSALKGWIYLFNGRRGFGPAHQGWVVRGSALLVAGLVGTIASIVVLAWLEVRAAIAGLGASSAIGTPLADEVLGVFVVVGTLGVLGFFARVLLVYALANERTQLVLWTGFALGTVVNGLEIVEAFAVIAPSAQAISSRSGLATASERIGLAGGVPAVLFPWAYYQLRRERTHPDPALRL